MVQNVGLKNVVCSTSTTFAAEWLMGVKFGIRKLCAFLAEMWITLVGSFGH